MTFTKPFSVTFVEEKQYNAILYDGENKKEVIEFLDEKVIVKNVTCTDRGLVAVLTGDFHALAFSPGVYLLYDRSRGRIGVMTEDEFLAKTSAVKRSVIKGGGE